jgi:tetratricopeptide (TPR) repeat protein
VGNALADAGRGAEAAPHFIAAAERAPRERALGLRTRAAQLLLSCGHFGDGIALIRRVLGEVGVAYPSSANRALAAALVGIARLELRGRRFTARDEADVPAEDLARLDALAAALKGLISFDSVRAASFLVRHARLALDAGEPRRVARGLAWYGMMLLYEGSPKSYAKALEIISEAEKIAAPLDDAYLRGAIATCRGIGRMGLTHWREGLALVEEGLSTYRDHCTGVAWECNTSMSAIHEAYVWLGQIPEMRLSVPPWRRQAERLNDLFSGIVASIYGAHVEIADGDIEGARAHTRAAIDRWWKDAYTYQHWLAAKNEIACDLYAGDRASASRRMDEAWRALRSADLHRVQMVRVYALLLRGALSASSPSASARGSAQRDATQLLSLDTESARGAAELIRALRCAHERRDDEAIVRLSASARSFDGAGMALHAAAVRRHRGVMLGGDEGSAIVAREEETLAAASVADPARFSATIVPTA